MIEKNALRISKIHLHFIIFDRWRKIPIYKSLFVARQRIFMLEFWLYNATSIHTKYAKKSTEKDLTLAVEIQ